MLCNDSAPLDTEVASSEEWIVNSEKSIPFSDHKDSNHHKLHLHHLVIFVVFHQHVITRTGTTMRGPKMPIQIASDRKIFPATVYRADIRPFTSMRPHMNNITRMSVECFIAYIARPLPLASRTRDRCG